MLLAVECLPWASLNRGLETSCLWLLFLMMSQLRYLIQERRGEVEIAARSACCIRFLLVSFRLGVVQVSFSRAANHPETSWLQILLWAVGSGSGGRFRGPGPTPAPAARCGLGCLAFTSAYPRFLLRAAPGFLHRGKVPGAARRGAPAREPCSSSCSCHVCCLPSPKRDTRPRPGWLWEALPQGAARAGGRRLGPLL